MVEAVNLPAVIRLRPEAKESWSRWHFGSLAVHRHALTAAIAVCRG